MKKIASKVVEVVHNLPMTQTLFRLKEKGKTPIIHIRINRKTNKPESAILQVGEVNYYFHDTYDHQGKSLKIKKQQNKYNAFYDIPYDGWEIEF